MHYGHILEYKVSTKNSAAVWEEDLTTARNQFWSWMRFANFSNFHPIENSVPTIFIKFRREFACAEHSKITHMTHRQGDCVSGSECRLKSYHTCLLASQSDAHIIAPHRDPNPSHPIQPTYSSRADRQSKIKIQV